MYSALAALEVVAQLNKVSIDSRAIIKKYALIEEEPSLNILIRICKNEGFKTKLKELSLSNLLKYPLPAIAPLKNNKFITILKVDEEKNELLLYDKEKNEPYTMLFEEFKQISNNKVIILKHKIINENVRFGFKWFFVQIMKYKRIVTEVLIASFVIQLFGLVTPLFTQVILDKVLVHQSISTLKVIAIAFLAVIVFELLLNLVRNYMFVHTTSKIDSKLG